MYVLLENCKQRLPVSMYFFAWIWIQKKNAFSTGRWPPKWKPVRVCILSISNLIIFVTSPLSKGFIMACPFNHGNLKWINLNRPPFLMVGIRLDWNSKCRLRMLNDSYEPMISIQPYFFNPTKSCKKKKLWQKRICSIHFQKKHHVLSNKLYQHFEPNKSVLARPPAG